MKIVNNESRGTRLEKSDFLKNDIISFHLYEFPFGFLKIIFASALSMKIGFDSLILLISLTRKSNF